MNGPHAQVKAFRLLVNRSATWADFDEELLALELQELNAADFNLDLTGFDHRELDDLLALPDEEKANAAPPLLRTLSPSLAISGSAGCTAYSAGTPPARKPWRSSSASASRA